MSIVGDGYRSNQEMSHRIIYHTFGRMTGTSYTSIGRTDDLKAYNPDWVVNPSDVSDGGMMVKKSCTVSVRVWGHGGYRGNGNTNTNMTLDIRKNGTSVNTFSAPSAGSSGTFTYALNKDDTLTFFIKAVASRAGADAGVVVTVS